MSNDGREVPLVGGKLTPGIVRIGATVHRPAKPNGAFVRALLRYLETVGFDGAPRLLGMDEQGREVLTFIVGDVSPSSAIQSDEHLASAARLIRRFHDATAGAPLAGDAVIVARHDLGPHNTVFRGERAVAFLDWDSAAPGSRLADFANAVWCFANLGQTGGSVDAQARRIALLCDAYGWRERAAIIEQIARQLREALDRHQQAGRGQAVAIYQAMVGWQVANGPALQRLL